MTDISKLTDHEKSVMLAKLCWWTIERRSFTPDVLFIIDGSGGNGRSHDLLYPYYLYDPANMALAWRVLNWATQHMPGKRGHRIELFRWFRENLVDFDKPPAEAQRLWLDRVLELAIEAGMVTAV